MSASDSSRQPETTVLGKWKTGLGISTVEQRVPFDLCLPEIGTTKEIVERAKPTVPVLPTAANLINSAGRNSVTPSPETPSARVRQFIREPQLH